MSTALAFPLDDPAFYATLPTESKVELGLLRDIMLCVFQADRPLAEIRRQANRLGGKYGFCEKTLIAKYYALRNGKPLIEMVNKSRLPRVQVSLPPAFIEHFRAYCERNQRKSRPAWRAMIADWQRGDPVPGYETRPPAAIHGVPAGWTYRNLMRYAPTPFERSAARVGRSAAASCRPLVLTTRVGLEPGQYYMFDDLEHDIKVNFLGVNRRAMRPLELCCLDLFSGCKIKWGMKPTIEDDGIKQKLKEREMRFLLAYVLCCIGYRPEGTVLVAEHGTAAIRPDIEEIINRASDGAITVDRSGIEGAASLVYEGRGKGNFRFKAPLESSHNLSHNELAALPGQMGLDRNHSPEELHGREGNNNALIKAMNFLPLERSNLLRLPFLEFNQFLQVAAEVIDRINARDWHDLEGWLEAGLVTSEVRFARDLPWVPADRLLALPAAERQAADALIHQPGNSRIRKLSPAEVWERGKSRLVKLPAFLAPQIIGDENGVERKIGKDSMIEFQDRELGPGTFAYLAEAKMLDGRTETLSPGETYLTYLNPFDPSILHVCRAGSGRGAYIGSCRRWDRVCRDDIEAVRRQMGAAAHQEAKLLAPYQARHTQEMRQRTADAKWNSAVLAGKPVTASERETHQRIVETPGDLKTIFGKKTPDGKEASAPTDTDAADQLSQIF